MTSISRPTQQNNRDKLLETSTGTSTYCLHCFTGWIVYWVNSLQNGDLATSKPVWHCCAVCYQRTLRAWRSLVDYSAVDPNTAASRQTCSQTPVIGQLMPSMRQTQTDANHLPCYNTGKSDIHNGIYQNYFYFFSFRNTDAAPGPIMQSMVYVTVQYTDGHPIRIPYVYPVDRSSSGRRVPTIHQYLLQASALSSKYG